MLPFLPEEKSNHIAFESLTKNDGVFSLLKGDSPFHSRPALRNFTRFPTTSDTGSRARNSSRNWGVNRISTMPLEARIEFRRSVRIVPNNSNDSVAAGHSLASVP